MPEQPGVQAEEAVGCRHGGHPRREHEPEFVGLVLVQELYGGHVSPHEVEGQGEVQTEGTEVEEGCDGTPQLKTEQELAVVQVQEWGKVVPVKQQAHDSGADGRGQVKTGEGGSGLERG